MMMMGGSNGMSTFSEIVEPERLKEEYTLLYGQWPSKYNELVVSVNDPNQISDLLLYSLGFRDTKELEDILKDLYMGEEITVHNDPMTISYDDLLGRELKLIDRSDLYKDNAANEIYEDMTDDDDYMMEVYNASVKAKDIVQRLADLSKKGKEESYKTLDPVEIIRSSLKVTLPAKPKNVEVRGRFSSGMARIRGDATQISQLVINIVLNAYDAMREKGGVLTVSTRIEEGGVAMRFTDTGTGMDAESIARIFAPFYTTKESGKGTGLGLAIVHQICDTHGAKVYVDSEPGAGTEFRIIFPIVEAENMDKATTRVINGAEIRERLDKPDEI